MHEIGSGRRRPRRKLERPRDVCDLDGATPRSRRRTRSPSGSRRTPRRGRDVRPAARTLVPRRASSRRSRPPAPACRRLVRASMNAMVASSCRARARRSGSWRSGSARARFAWARTELPAVRSAAAARSSRLARWPLSGVSCAARASSSADAARLPRLPRPIGGTVELGGDLVIRTLGRPRHGATPFGQGRAPHRSRPPVLRGLDTDRRGWRLGRRPSE